MRTRAWPGWPRRVAWLAEAARLTGNAIGPVVVAVVVVVVVVIVVVVLVLVLVLVAVLVLVFVLVGVVVVGRFWRAQGGKRSLMRLRMR